MSEKCLRVCQGKSLLDVIFVAVVFVACVDARASVGCGDVGISVGSFSVSVAVAIGTSVDHGALIVLVLVC